MGLYQQVRPGSLDEIVGNTATVKALKKMLQLARKPHAVLLQGPSGCGKTTIGRILGKEFGSSEGSIFELNAANTRGIDDVRSIAQTAHMSTLGGGSKTYIIDESHQLTKAAQQAFLKILEDSPENCYFVLCTTDPQNLISTIRNRCTDYTMAKLGDTDLMVLLKRACEKAELKVPEEIVQIVAATSDGSPRAALVALEKVQGIEDADVAIGLLLKGTEHDVTIKEMCQLMNNCPAVRRKKYSQIINLFDMLEEDPERIRTAILWYLYKMAITCKPEDVEEAMDLAHLMRIFSGNCFYGGKPQLGSLIIQACFMKNLFSD